MPVLGHGGIVKIKREPPEDVILRRTDSSPTTDTVDLVDKNFWSGDQVTLTSTTGVPTGLVEDGVGMYFGSIFDLASNRTHITSAAAEFYQATDTPEFWFTGTTQLSVTLYIHRDVLDRVSFYNTKAGALNGALTDRLPVRNLDWGSCVMSFVPSNWAVQGLLNEWTLDLSANSVDITGVGETYGDAVKALVTGGGRFQFMVDRQAPEDGSYDPTTLMRLLFMLNKGSKLYTQFWMIENRSDYPCGDLLAGDLYYEADILVTSVSINTRADDLIAGTAQFVTTGPIPLKMGV